MGRLIRVTVTEANRGFTRLISKVDENGIVLLTKQGIDSYAMLSNEVFNDVKGEIMKKYVTDDKFISNVKNNNAFRDKAGCVYRIWIENDNLDMVKAFMDDGKIIAFSFCSIPAEKTDVERENDGSVMVNVSNLKSDMIHMETYDALSISDTDYEAKSRFDMAKSVLEAVNDASMLPYGKVEGMNAFG